MYSNLKRFLRNENWSKFLSWFVGMNVLAFLVIFSLIYFLDIESVEGEISLGQLVLNETILLIILVLIEVIFVIWLGLKYFSRHPISEVDINDILSQDESEFLEFKSTLRWDLKKNDVEKHIEHSVVKTLASFLNTNGGVLLIGVSDKSEVLGLEKDYNSLKKKNRDGFLLHLNQIIIKHLGKDVTDFIDVDIMDVDNKDICVVSVTHSKKPVFMRDGKNETFYVRTSNSTQALSVSEAHSYISNHW